MDYAESAIRDSKMLLGTPVFIDPSFGVQATLNRLCKSSDKFADRDHYHGDGWHVVMRKTPSIKERRADAQDWVFA